MPLPSSAIDRRTSLKTLGLGFLALQMPTPAFALGLSGTPEETRANEVSEYLQKNYWDGKRDLYMDKPGGKGPVTVWGGGVMFSSLVAAARHDKRYLTSVRQYFKGLDTYWDTGVKIPGYEPLPTGGGGNDKYYDDNAWMVLTFLEAHELTGDMKFLRRAKETLDFVLSGWDEEGGGGIWWHEKHKGNCKNTCINAPAALGCFRLSKFADPKNAAKLIEQGQKIVEWTVKTLQADNGLFKDSINLLTKEVNHAQLTYNSALMLRCFLWLHSFTKKPEYLKEANRIAKAADSLLDNKTGAYRDSVKWSHLMVEADIEMYRHTNQISYYNRAKKTCEVNYQAWKAKPDDELIQVSSIARELWLLADMESSVGRQFWEKSDRVTK